MDDGDWKFDLYCLAEDQIILIPLFEESIVTMTEAQAQEWLSKQELYTPIVMSLVDVKITKSEFNDKIEERRYNQLIAEIDIRF